MTKAKAKKKQRRAKGLKSRQHSARGTPSAHALLQKGMAALTAGDADTAQQCFEDSLALRPDADIYHKLGSIHFSRNDFAAAEAAFRSVWTMRPQSPQAARHLGVTLLNRGRFLEARHVLEKALSFGPTAGIINTLSLVLFQSGESELAESVLKDALVQYPRDAGLYETRGHFLIAQGRLPEARQSLEHALMLQPSLVNIHLKLAEISMLQGDYARGFTEFEHAPLFNDKGLPFVLPRPRWRGEGITGKRLYVIPADGFGDVIQFSRFLVGMKQRTGAHIVFRCQEPLAPLFVSEEWDVICEEPDKNDFDMWVPVMSLPALRNMSREQFASDYPPFPLAVAPYDLARWKTRVPDSHALKIGVCWAGNSTHSHDYRRSFHLADMAPLATVPGVEFYSLQIGDAGQEAQRPPAGMIVRDLTAAIDDFMDTAALIAQLDLVVSVDTSTVHLAGSLNKPTWVALNLFCEWRWEQNRKSQDSVWYPTARLFVQPKLYDWHSVFVAMASELRALVQQREGIAA